MSTFENSICACQAFQKPWRFFYFFLHERQKLIYQVTPLVKKEKLQSSRCKLASKLFWAPIYIKRLVNNFFVTIFDDAMLCRTAPHRWSGVATSSRKERVLRRGGEGGAERGEELRGAEASSVPPRRRRRKGLKAPVKGSNQSEKKVVLADET